MRKHMITLLSFCLLIAGCTSESHYILNSDVVLASMTPPAATYQVDNYSAQEEIWEDTVHPLSMTSYIMEQTLSDSIVYSPDNFIQALESRRNSRDDFTDFLMELGFVCEKMDIDFILNNFVLNKQTINDIYIDGKKTIAEVVYICDPAFITCVFTKTEGADWILKDCIENFSDVFFINDYYQNHTWLVGNHIASGTGLEVVFRQWYNLANSEVDFSYIYRYKQVEFDGAYYWITRVNVDRDKIEDPNYIILMSSKCLLDYDDSTHSYAEEKSQSSIQIYEYDNNLNSIGLIKTVTCDDVSAAFLFGLSTEDILRWNE